MKAPSSKPRVKLIGQDGNAFAIIKNIKIAINVPVLIRNMSMNISKKLLPAIITIF
jgi:hypothetical protein